MEGGAAAARGNGSFRLVLPRPRTPRSRTGCRKGGREKPLAISSNLDRSIYRRSLPGHNAKPPDYVERESGHQDPKHWGWKPTRGQVGIPSGTKWSSELSVHVLREGDIVFGREECAVDRHLLVTYSPTWLDTGIRLYPPPGHRRLSLPCFAYFRLSLAESSRLDAQPVRQQATMASLNHDVISRIPRPFPTALNSTESRTLRPDCLAQITNLHPAKPATRAARDLLLPRFLMSASD